VNGATGRQTARLFCLAVLLALPGWAQDLLKAEVAIESQDVFVGQPIMFQITVTGADQPQAPDLAAVAPDFAVQYLGPRANNSTQISIVNGRMSRTVTVETILMYRLTPKRAGDLQIPALTVTAGGHQAMTPPVPVRAREPDSPGQATGGIALRMELSRDTVTVGEPVTVTWTWTVSSEVRGFDFSLPLFEMAGVDLPKIEPVIDPQLRDRYVGIRIPDGRQLVALQTARRTPTGSAVDVVFSQVLIPRQAGNLVLPKSTVVCEVLVPTTTPRRRNSPFGNPFFDDDVFGQRGTYRRAAVVSNEPTLTVKPLPAAGQPADFAGHVGSYRMQVTAEPTEVNVGDPITLTITLAGPEYLDPVEGPDLERNEELNRSFRLSPAEPGVLDGRAKVFKRILRAKTADVTRIPPLRLPYFDSAAQEYRVAESPAIPLSVKAVKVVTALDAQGNSAPVAEAGRKLQAWSRGIAANCEDLGALTDQHVGPDAWLRSPTWGAALALPPLLWAVTLAVATTVRRRNADPAARRSRQALARARRQLKGAAGAGPEAPARVLEALREYFGAKLRQSSGALVFRDVEGALRERGVAAADLQAIRELFEVCEAGRYAGGLGAAGRTGTELAESARQCLAAIDGKMNGL